MRRKDKRIAAIIRRSLEHVKRQSGSEDADYFTGYTIAAVEIATDIADMLAMNDSDFDVRGFMRACGIPVADCFGKTISELVEDG